MSSGLGHEQGAVTWKSNVSSTKRGDSITKSSLSDWYIIEKQCLSTLNPNVEEYSMLLGVLSLTTRFHPTLIAIHSPYTMLLHYCTGCIRTTNSEHQSAFPINAHAGQKAPPVESWSPISDCQVLSLSSVIEFSVIEPSAMLPIPSIPSIQSTIWALHYLSIYLIREISFNELIWSYYLPTRM